MGKLDGKVAVITGSSQGIGRAVALSMAAEGAKVVVNNRKPAVDGGADAEKVANEIIAAGGVALPVYADVSQESECVRLIDTAIKEFGSVDILVNNAGISSGDSLEMFTEEAADKEFRIGLYSAIWTCREAIPHMLENGYGRIINTSSITALHWSWVYTTTYTCVKAAVYGLTRLIARSYGHQGITANIAMPDVNTRLTDTKLEPMMEQAMMGWYASGTIDQGILAHCLNLPEPEECAAFYTYLASPEASYINGKTFKISDDIELLAEPDRVRFLVHNSGEIWTVDQFAQQVPGMMSDSIPCPPYPALQIDQPE